MDNRMCYECGHAMAPGVKPMTISYQGLSKTVEMPGLYCTSCDEGILSGKDLAISDRALNELKVQAEDLLAPAEIRRIRRKLRLTQTKAGAILGGGPNAFHKYESGAALPSQAICIMLRILDEFPNAVAVLWRRAGRNRDHMGETPLPF